MYYESTSAATRWLKTEIINCLLHMKINAHETMIWCSQQKDASYHQSVRMIKSLFTRSKVSDNHQVES